MTDSLRDFFEKSFVIILKSMPSRGRFLPPRIGPARFSALKICPSALRRESMAFSLLSISKYSI